MMFSGKRYRVFLLALVSIAAAADKDHERLQVRPADTYPYKQTAEGVTIAAEVYETGAKAKAAFGKYNPYDYGVLPILVVIDNHTSKSISVEYMKVEYAAPGQGSVEATPAQEVRFLTGVSQPRTVPGPSVPGIPGLHHTKTNPLAEWEIEGRAFAAKIIPPNESASGFFYFQTGHRSHSKLTLSNIEEAATHRELIFFELPLEPVQ